MCSEGGAPPPANTGSGWDDATTEEPKLTVVEGAEGEGEGAAAAAAARSGEAGEAAATADAAETPAEEEQAPQEEEVKVRGVIGAASHT